MAEILFLAHRVPYPLDKGEKIRAYHMLHHLARSHRVHLGAFIDDPADIEPARHLDELCVSTHFSFVSRAQRQARMLGGLARGEALSQAVLRDRSMQRWVEARYRAGVEVTIGSSGAVMRHVGRGPLVFDLVDCDSEKWQALAQRTKPPLRWIYAREARLIRRLEQHIAQRADATILVSEPEAELCRHIVPEAANRIHAIANGVDVARLDPTTRPECPYPVDGRPTLIFTGVMSYAPNIEAVLWFYRHVWPSLRQREPALRLAIVGSAPSREVRALARGDEIIVTGRVADVRPYLAHATIAIAPLQLARGIQNKVLEAMAMSLPVVATSGAALGIEAQAGRHLAIADEPAAFAEQLASLLDDPVRRASMGDAARRLVEERYVWEARLAPLDRLIEEALGSARPAP